MTSRSAVRGLGPTAARAEPLRRRRRSPRPDRKDVPDGSRPGGAPVLSRRRLARTGIRGRKRPDGSWRFGPEILSLDFSPDGAWLASAAVERGVRIWDGSILRSVRVGDGLAGPEVNRDAMWCDADGTMWVGTDRGITRFDPGFLMEPRVEPLVEFLGFELDGEPISANGPIRRRGPVSLLVACFRGISFVDERRIRYRTWLEGFESDWQPLAAAPMRELRYTNLPSGTYRFHVQAVAPQGETSRVAVSAPLEVVPPIWLTWWFLTGVAVSVVVVAVELPWIQFQSSSG